jgi:hypothetical protein
MANYQLLIYALRGRDVRFYVVLVPRKGPFTWKGQALAAGKHSAFSAQPSPENRGPIAICQIAPLLDFKDREVDASSQVAPRSKPKGLAYRARDSTIAHN